MISETRRSLTGEGTGSAVVEMGPSLVQFRPLPPGQSRVTLELRANERGGEKRVVFASFEVPHLESLNVTRSTVRRQPDD